ncbi:Predicted acetyltransferase [Lachnospiraceae bacterium NK3A20]|nr:Predicted acetyltransferase [Lachnospiraceae bacterium NK3A20]
MELRKINLRDIKAQWAYTAALPEDENGLTNPYHGVSFDEYRDKVLPALISYEHPINMPDWFVPETYYYLWDDGCLIGEFRIRHYLTDALRKGAGHIGYSISKEHRGKGCGTEGLRLTLQIAREIVPEEEIYLRVNKDNIASQKVMIHNGAFRAGADEDHFFMRIGKSEVRQMQLINDDYLGHVDVLRHACRGILVHDGKLLLCYEPNSDKYITPGGGLEGNETYAECCEREMLEETGMKVRAETAYLDVEELFDVQQHINHYFICDFVEDTGCRHLTEAEKRAGYTYVWMPLAEAMELFAKYEDYHDRNIAIYGLYKREFTALKEYEKT